MVRASRSTSSQRQRRDVLDWHATRKVRQSSVCASTGLKAPTLSSLPTGGRSSVAELEPEVLLQRPGLATLSRPLSLPPHLQVGRIQCSRKGWTSPSGARLGAGAPPRLGVGRQLSIARSAYASARALVLTLSPPPAQPQAGTRASFRQPFSGFGDRQRHLQPARCPALFPYPL